MKIGYNTLETDIFQYVPQGHIFKYNNRYYCKIDQFSAIDLVGMNVIKTFNYKDKIVPVKGIEIYD